MYVSWLGMRSTLAVRTPLFLPAIVAVSWMGYSPKLLMLMRTEKAPVSLSYVRRPALSSFSSAPFSTVPVYVMVRSSVRLGGLVAKLIATGGSTRVAVMVRL